MFSKIGTRVLQLSLRHRSSSLRRVSFFAQGLCSCSPSSRTGLLSSAFFPWPTWLAGWLIQYSGYCTSRSRHTPVQRWQSDMVLCIGAGAWRLPWRSWVLRQMPIVVVYNEYVFACCKAWLELYVVVVVLHLPDLRLLSVRGSPFFSRVALWMRRMLQATGESFLLTSGRMKRAMAIRTFGSRVISRLIGGSFVIRRSSVLETYVRENRYLFRSLWSSSRYFLSFDVMVMQNGSTGQLTCRWF